ncbi:hypothetical protein Cl131_gp052 [Aphanizomenon phage vB_AphaS-CL131]|nr:hypothetical protein Cl131_gp052 [Aphanizomenon phage vB_AphaS-CL131]
MNDIAILPQQQGISILSRQQIAETRELAIAFAETLENKQLLTHMGMFNAYAWRAAMNHNALYYEGDKYMISYPEWNNLLNCSHQGQLEIVVATEWLQEYIKENWKGACHSENTLRKYRKQQIELGLFYFDVENRPKGAFWGSRNGQKGHATATPPKLEKVDLPRILIFYQVFDQIYRYRVSQALIESENITAFDCMPDHGGMVMVELYNALNISDFRGNVGASEIVCEPQEEVAIAKPRVAFKWRNNPKNYFDPAIWKYLVESAKFVASQVKEVVVEITSELMPLGSLDEVPY